MTDSHNYALKPDYLRKNSACNNYNNITQKNVTKIEL